MPRFTCERPGCKWDRSYRTDRNGELRRTRHCSAECFVWCRRAHGAVAAGSGDVAVKLLWLSELLDARRSPDDRVPEVFDHPDPRG